jgi:hypothetical protein
MTEENKQAPEVAPILGENQGRKVDNRLPYEAPQLRKHGKVNDITTVGAPFNGNFDNPFFAQSDFS